MKAFEKMEKREERRKELQKIHEKKESPDAQPVKSKEPVKASQKQATPVQQQPKGKGTPAAKVLVQQQSTNTPAKVPTARRKRNRSGPVLRRRNTSNSAASEPTSETETDDKSNVSGRRLRAREPALVEVSSRIPAPAEVGSTATGTTGASTGTTNTPFATSFRFPKTKKVSGTLGLSVRCKGKCVVVYANGE